MKNLQVRFQELKETKKSLSDYLCFSNAVYGKGFSFNEIKTNFLKLVDRSDYSRSDLDEILQDLYRMSLIGQS
jgi:hypothetical protein